MLRVERALLTNGTVWLIPSELVCLQVGTEPVCKDVKMGLCCLWGAQCSAPGKALVCMLLCSLHPP